METAKREGFDAVILDTAGRLAIDHELMMEVALVRDTVEPAETLLVADALSGQDAVATAQAFNDKVGITGIVLTRIDGDSRGGSCALHAGGHRLSHQAHGGWRKTRCT